MRRPKCKRAASRSLSRFAFAGLWDVGPSRTLRLNDYGESLESQGLAQRSLMRAAQEYDESDRNSRQSYNDDDIYHRGCL